MLQHLPSRWRRLRLMELPRPRLRKPAHTLLAGITLHPPTCWSGRRRRRHRRAGSNMCANRLNGACLQQALINGMRVPTLSALRLPAHNANCRHLSAQAPDRRLATSSLLKQILWQQRSRPGSRRAVYEARSALQALTDQRRGQRGFLAQKSLVLWWSYDHQRVDPPRQQA